MKILHTFLMSMIIFFMIIFLMMNHPLSMGLILMTQTLLITLFSGSLSLNFWFSYSLFLIFMGGMLILFMYMTSLASNEIFKMSLNKNMILLMMNLIVLILIISYFLDFKSMNLNLMKNFENYSLMTMKNFILTNNQNLLNKMFNFPNNMISILLINYLLLTLIASVKITNIFKGPLRPSYN